MFAKSNVAKYNDWSILGATLEVDGSMVMLVETGDESFDEESLSLDDLAGLEGALMRVVAKEDSVLFNHLNLDEAPLGMKVWTQTDSKLRFCVEIEYATKFLN
jgi:hypothetical protein